MSGTISDRSCGLDAAVTGFALKLSLAPFAQRVGGGQGIWRCDVADGSIYGYWEAPNIVLAWFELGIGDAQPSELIVRKWAHFHVAVRNRVKRQFVVGIFNATRNRGFG